MFLKSTDTPYDWQSAWTALMEKFILSITAGSSSAPKEFSLSLKLVSAIIHRIFIFSPNDSASKTMKNAFYFI